MSGLGYEVCLLDHVTGKFEFRCNLWVKLNDVNLLSSTHLFLDVTVVKPNGIKGSSTFDYGVPCYFSFVVPCYLSLVSLGFCSVCFPGHPDRAFRINFVKRTFSHSVVSAGEANLMDLMEEHVKKEYGADVFSRDDFVYSVSFSSSIPIWEVSAAELLNCGQSWLQFVVRALYTTTPFYVGRSEQPCIDK